jgi:hypothetical protein
MSIFVVVCELSSGGTSRDEIEAPDPVEAERIAVEAWADRGVKARPLVTLERS